MFLEKVNWIKIQCVHFLHILQKTEKLMKPNFYNFDVIISVGYRVKSKQGTQFRRWATQQLRDYLAKGYVINEND